MATEFQALSTEVVLSQSRSTLCCQSFDWNPQPGNYLEIEGQSYLILERQHRYFLKAGRYQLQKVVLLVQPSVVPIERGLWEGRWVIGDGSCLYNARSEVLRCAVNPSGPCDRCSHYRSG
jgi:hypothetical protein